MKKHMSQKHWEFFEQEVYHLSYVLLDYALPQVAKLTKTLQTENLDVTVITLLDEKVLLNPLTNCLNKVNCSIFWCICNVLMSKEV